MKLKRYHHFNNHGKILKETGIDLTNNRYLFLGSWTIDTVYPSLSSEQDLLENINKNVCFSDSSTYICLNNTRPASRKISAPGRVFDFIGFSHQSYSNL